MSIINMPRAIIAIFKVTRIHCSPFPAVRNRLQPDIYYGRIERV